MTSQWQYIPDTVIDDVDRRKKADEWAASERQRVADEWAAQQQTMLSESTPTLEQYNAGRGFVPGASDVQGASDIQGPGDAGIYPPMKEMLRRGVEDQQGALPRVMNRISSLAEPAAEFIARGGERLGAAVRGEDWQSMPSGYDANNSLEQNIVDLRAGYKQRPEHFPGEKFITQIAADPTNVVPSGLLGKAGMQVVREGRPIAEAAGALSKYVPGLGTEVETAAKRFYHGTGSVFDTPDAGKFDPNGLYGPGYYMTDAPEVAGSYAGNRGNVLSSDVKYQAAQDALANFNHVLKIAISEGDTARVAAIKRDIADVENALKSGPNVRAIDVPEGLRLLDAEGPVADLLDIINQNAPGTVSNRVENAVGKNSSFVDIYRELAFAFGGDFRKATNILERAGYDGIRYAGGKRIPLMDDAGRPIEHTALVIFPESLSKIKNAISGLPMGIKATGAGLRAGSAATGGITGAATGAQQGDTPEERAKNAALGFAGGLAGGTLLGIGAGKAIDHFAAKPPPLYKPVQHEGLGMIWDRSRNVIARQGAAGKDLAGRLVKWREGAERQAGAWVHQMPTVRSLTKSEFDNFVDVAENKAAPVNDKVRQAFIEWDDVRNQIADDASILGVLTGRRSDYFPHSWEAKDLQKLLGDKNQRLSVLQSMVKSGKADNLEEAQKILYRIDEQIRTQKSSALEMERVMENVPGWKRDLHSLLGYVEDSAKRISYASQFGAGHEKVNELLVKITESGHDAVAAEQAFKMAAGGGGSNSVVDAVRAFNVFSKLGLGALTNAAQSANTATVTGGLRTLMNTPRAMFSKEAKEFAVEAGVTLDSTIAALREGGGVVTGMAKVGAPGFNNVERFNRTLASVAGRDMARAAFKKGDAKTLQSLGIDAQLVLSRGRLSPQDEITAARNVVERTQFKVDPQDLPWWASTPLGKLLMQFRTFSYNQSAFMWREVIEPAVKDHNMKPLIRFMVYGGVTGAALTEMQDFIKGRDTTGENIKDYISRYYQRVGGIGVLGDIIAGLNPPGGSSYQSGERYAMQAVGTVLGPSAGTFTEGVAAIPSALQGDPERLERFALKQVPVVGPPIANRVLPYGPKKSKAPNRYPGRYTPPKSNTQKAPAYPGRR